MKSHRTPTILPKVLLCTVSFYALTASSLAADKKAPPAKPADQYLAFDAHPQEHVTIAADPCTSPSDCSFFRVPYIQHGFIPIRVIITNDGDTGLSLDDARIQFISANHDVIAAATLDDINRRLFSTSSAMGTKVPLVPWRIHHAPVDKKITNDDSDFGFQGTTVKAHSTLAGYLFYDVSELDGLPLKGAQLYLKEIHTLEGNQQLFAFTIPFEKWLAANAANLQKASVKN
ncbi:hypothetical protein [Edaphobacter bradus]|uniref:hypothetical protein n=1 Tax=Edaphobacter bradus TaxID=2259016 RepID=UPI0021E0285A|nr:hypothetical protein [Edaphobacter bradus]